MEHFMAIAIGTVTTRPYVFAFLTVYLIAAILHLGWRKTVAFTVVGYLIAFASEVSSINNGFPYGWYYYIDTTSSHELWIAGVPFFDSLSYVFLTYCSYVTALLILGPVKAWRGNFVVLETNRFRRSFAVLCLASLLQVFLDIIIDPVALQGRRWFLGQIYGYREVGVHYGVPLSNYLGWLLVSFLLVLALQQIDAWFDRRHNDPTGMSGAPYRSLYGPLLYLSVLVFNLGITCWIGEYQMATTGIFTYVLPLAIVIIQLARRVNRYSRDELAAHLRDYPHSPAAQRGN